MLKLLNFTFFNCVLLRYLTIGPWKFTRHPATNTIWLNTGCKYNGITFFNNSFKSSLSLSPRFRATMAQTTMAHASMASPLWRMPEWRRSSMTQVQHGAFHYGAVPVCRISVWRMPVCRSSGVALFQCVAVSPSVARRHASMAHALVCRSSGVALFQCVAVSPSVARRHASMAHASMPQFRCGAVPVCRICGSFMPVWRMPVCRSSGVALFQCVAVSPSVARRHASMAHASMPQFRCGAVPVCRSFAVGGSPSCQYGACQYAAVPVGAVPVCRSFAVGGSPSCQYAAVPVWRCSSVSQLATCQYCAVQTVWRCSSVSQFRRLWLAVMPVWRASMPQFRCGAVPRSFAVGGSRHAIWRMPVCRSSGVALFQWNRSFAVGGSPSCQYAAVPVWRCSSVSQFRRRWLAVMPVCRSSGVALFQCVAVSPSVARRHASMPQFRCGAVMCRSFAVGSPSCQWRSSGVALFQCVAVSRLARNMPVCRKFRCGAVPVCRSFAVGGSPSCQYGACIRHSNNDI